MLPSSSPKPLFNNSSRSSRITSSSCCVSGLRHIRKNLIGKSAEFKAVLSVTDKDAIVALVIAKELNAVLYERPAGWFAYLEGMAKLGCPTPDEIDRIAEAKASRDVLVHNRGEAGRIYELKAGKLARYEDGQRIDIPEHYHRDTWELVRKVIDDASIAAIAKFP
jgi:hypothetical protein